jgi:SNF2 family DNA or RNA helicase
MYSIICCLYVRYVTYARTRSLFAVSRCHGCYVDSTPKASNPIVMSVELDSKQRLVVRTPFQYAPVCQRIPDKRAWDKRLNAWIVTPSRINIEYLKKEFPEARWSMTAEAVAEDVTRRGQPPVKASVDDFTFATPAPYAHQREAFARFRNSPVGALLMEQRTGKTRSDIDDSADAFLRSLIDLHVVVCPNSVKSNWVQDEIPRWMPPGVPYETILYRSGDRKAITKQIKEWRGGRLQFLVVNCECLSTSIGEDWLADLMKGRKVKMTVDEASRFKSPTSSRSKALLRLRKFTVRRRIATGTLVTQGPLDAYIPFSFLDPAILGYSSFYAFRNDFALLGGYMGRSIIGYVNTDRLADLIAPFSYRVTRDQCFDMPPKVYSKIEVDLTDTQRQLYNDMKDQLLAEFEDPNGIEVPVYDANGEQTGTRRVQQISATIILTKMLRLAQITGGFFPAHEGGPAVPIPGKNPKLEALMEGVEECRGKVIVWARFRPEIALISESLRKAYGTNTVVEFHGGIKEADRTVNRRRFQDMSDPCRWFVGHTAAGGIGIPLHAADDVFYFSNDFSLEGRLQSEDRAQNLEKRHKVGYTDIVARDTLDMKAIQSLRTKNDMARIINKDNFREWI